MSTIDITSQCTFTPANNTVMSSNDNFSISWNNGQYVQNYPITVYNRNIFNKPYNISHNNCENLFSNCILFNQPVNIPNNASCWNMFSNCFNFNQPIDLVDPIQVRDMFTYSMRFNSPVNIFYSVDNRKTNSLSWMFAHCYNFNSPIRIISNQPNISMPTGYAYMFVQCFNFNQPIDSLFNNFTNKYINSYLADGDIFTGMFYQCSNFNQPVTFPDISPVGGELITGMGYMGTFEDCGKLNSPIKIGNGVTYMNGTFHNCKLLNSPVTIGKDVNIMTEAFHNCYRFNQPINIPVGIGTMDQAFDSCLDFNQSVSIPYTVASANGLFNNCIALNKSISIDMTRLGDANNMFRNCRSLNVAPTFVNVANSEDPALASRMFANCHALNKPIHFDYDCFYEYWRMFEGCYNLTTVGIECNNVNMRDQYGQVDLSYTFANCFGDRTSHLYVYVNANNIGTLDVSLNNMLDGWPINPTNGARVNIYSYETSYGSEYLTYIINQSTPLTFTISNGSVVNTNWWGQGIRRKIMWNTYTNAAYNILVNFVHTESA